MKIESAQVNIVNKHEGHTHVYEKRTEIHEANETVAPELVQESIAPSEDELSMQTSAKMYILKLLIQKLTGKDVEWYDDVVGKEVSHLEMSRLMERVEGGETEQSTPTQIIVERLTNESQSNALKLDGQITLEGGQRIDFAFKAMFEQSHTSYQKTIENVNMKDPLIISFTNKSVELDRENMQFDIDADGQVDSFAYLKEGYGYLALDLNGNDKIDDGRELFGALSGNGFADLSKYDQDKNGFIDENDEVFSSLKVWVKNKGEDKLLTLNEANIGAVALQNVDTPLNIREQGELKGAVRKSGFYLDEQGNPNLIQQVDYVV
ncbi:hypothetical protein [Pseudoalteromonas luteoviolacea]|uniref:VCBS repeat-containing protein n=1 Tax=Pseudoalteromonas luteoviolacea DSM 6061 TaxID=1365250 RepID=A0A166V2K1_9GAMM|nr:hypothetical protein [Pseudoalteromonas luteoviolacea]KZN31646.1 hypothetical protein N475_04125 [Pseudoalteromonas luteoviolacea DSM 6061]MBE0388979.1 hypothetical protein [Pseudoalteromonas luteoviolacea DSM 6061]